MEVYYAFLRLIVVFPLVILSIYFGLRFFLKRFGPALNLGGRGIRVLERAPLDSRSFLYLVKVGEHYLLISSSSTGGVNLLKDLGEGWEEEYSRVLKQQEAVAGKEEETPVFAALLEKIRKGSPRETFLTGKALWRKILSLAGRKHKIKENGEEDFGRISRNFTKKQDVEKSLSEQNLPDVPEEKKTDGQERKNRS